MDFHYGTHNRYLNKYSVNAILKSSKKIFFSQPKILFNIMIITYISKRGQEGLTLGECFANLFLRQWIK